jgi:hypothetical protein
MKKIYLIITALFISILTLGQVPQAFKYQAVVRDTTGNVIQDQLVSLKISILKGSVDGEVVYSEMQDVNTNKLGLVNLEIGRGLVTAGNFSDISWGDDDYFIKIELDVNGGMNYTYMGTSQLLSVPYALYAETAGNQGSSGESYWKPTTGGIYYNEGKVGINKTNPLYNLDLNGTLNVTGDGKISNIFQVGTSKFYVSSTGLVGIGTATPAEPLSIEGQSVYQSGRVFLRIHNRSLDEFSCTGIQISAGHGNSNGYIFHQSDSYSIFNSGYPDNTILWNNGTGLVLRSDPGGHIAFEITNRNSRSFKEYMRMNDQGYFGIGTSDPRRPLHVSDVMRMEPRDTPPSNPSEGDIYMDGNTHKLKVYDGTTWQSCW